MAKMVVKGHILKSIEGLDKRYNQALGSANPQDSIYYSKLAVLEYCGWLEESFDLIVRRALKGKLRTQPYKQMLEDGVIGNNYGFQYKENLRPMLIRAVGLSRMESLETSLNRSGMLPVLISELESVKNDRNSAAHTWINGPTRTYPAPSVTKARLEKVYPIAKELYSMITKL